MFRRLKLISHLHYFLRVLKKTCLLNNRSYQAADKVSMMLRIVDAALVTHWSAEADPTNFIYTHISLSSGLR